MQIDPAPSAGSKAPEVNAEHPWLGLLPYKEEHRDFFFGRDREVEDILGRIRDNSLTILYGQSGWGKSSLLAAGVVPRLRENGFAPKIIRLRYSDRATMREQMLAKLPNRPPFTGSALDPSWQPGKATLWELFHRKTNSTPDQPVTVLIFDQFEEIFTLGAQPDFVNQVADWLEQMADLLQNRPPRQLAERFAQDHALADQYYFGDAAVRIVFTLREDYLAQLERWKGKLPLLMQNRMALTLLTGPQARQAVLGPAQLGDHSLVSREVAESIVRRVAGAAESTPLDQIKAVPPFLSLLCEQLNAARFGASGDAKRARITAEMVRGDSDTILQDFYEKTFLKFEEPHGKVIRAWFEDSFITQTEPAYRNTLIRGEAEGQLTRAGVADAKAIFDTLIQRRLVTAEMRDQVQRLEITHDVLVPLLLRSRKERQDREAKEQAERAAVAAEAERARLARERRRLRYAVVGFAALAIAAIGFAVYGWWQAQVARKAEMRAEKESRYAVAVSREAQRLQLEATAAAFNARESNKKNLRTLHEASMADYAVAVQRIEKDNKWHEGVAHLARSLKWEPDNWLAATRLYSTLSFYAAEKQTWPRKVLTHESRVASAQFSPDGTRIVTTIEKRGFFSKGEARIWDVASGKPIGEPLSHEKAVTSAQFSADGRRIVTASEDYTARVWDASSGRPIGAPIIHKYDVKSAQFSADGTRIVTASDFNTARVWDVASGKPIGEPMRHESSINSAQFSADGTRILTASYDNTARVWDAASGKPIGEPMSHENDVNNAQFSADGMRIVTASNDDTARVWDAASGKPMGEPLRHEGHVKSAQFSADGTRIVTTCEDGMARVWDAASGKPTGQPMPHNDDLNSAQFSADGIRIVTACSDNAVRVWDAASGKQLGEPLLHEDSVNSAQFSPDGMYIITASEDKTARVWDAPSGKRPGEPLRHARGVNSAQFSADGMRIVTASYDNTARVWDAVSGKPIGGPLNHESYVMSAQFSADGSHIVTAGDDNTSRVWDTTSGKLLGEPMPHQNGVNSAAFSADGTRIVTASWDHTARVWDAVSGKPIGGLLIHEASVNNAAFSPDGTRIVTASGNLYSEHGETRVWDAVSGKQLGESLRHKGPAESAQFSADGRRIVTAGWDKTAQVWDAVSGKPIGEPLRHENVVKNAQFSADGMHIVTASVPDNARVWNAATGKPLGEPLRHEARVEYAQFSPDGTRIVTASDDKTARVWDVKLMLRPPDPVPEWMLQHARAIAGLTFDDDGQLKALRGEQQLTILREPPPGNDAWTQLARWLVLPAYERTLTPESKFTFRQIAERERDSGTEEGIESALRYDPTVPLAHVLLAEFEDNPQRAAFLRDFGLKRLPEDARLWSKASLSLVKQNQPGSALEAARKAIALNAGEISAHRALAYALAASGQQIDALKSWDKVLAAEPTTFEDFCDAGYLAAELNLGDRARAIFREGEVRFSSIPSILRIKGKSLLLLHDPTEALATLVAYEAKLAAFDGGKPPSGAVATLSVSRWLTGDKERAVADYQRLIGMASGYADVDAVTKSVWHDAIKKPMLEVLEETLKRHPELRLKKEEK